MPEGHTIHRLAAELNRRFASRSVQVSSPQGRFTESAALLDGATFRTATAYGKHVFIDFEQDRFVHIHLGLFGRVAFGLFGAKAADRPQSTWAGRDIAYLSGVTTRTAPAVSAATEDDTDDEGDAAVVDPAEDGEAAPPEPRGAVRLRLIGDGDYLDLRGPTACELLDPAGVAKIRARLGPDPLRRDGREDEFVRRVRARRVDVGALLMDQSVVAGIGNVYRAELLYRHLLSPFRLGRDVDEQTLGAMWADLRVLMRSGVRTGRIVTTRPADRPHPRGAARRDEAHYVYRRTALPCRICGTPVATRIVAGRNLFWCPTCQGG